MAKASKKPSKSAPAKNAYSAESITVLEGLEPVRKRPGMYIGTTGIDGLHHLIWEVFDNGRDEAMGGFANDIEVTLLSGNRVRVADNGRGIPVDIHKQTKVSALETIMTTLHAGAKFGGDGYKVSGGLHGVGVSVVNALSVYTKAEVHRDGGYYIQEYVRGKEKAKVKKVASSDWHGTVITFEADPQIFPEIKYEWTRIISHMRQQAYLVKGCRISVIDARAYPGKIDLADVRYFRDLKLLVPSVTYYFEGGLKSLVTFNNRFQKPIHDTVFYVEKEVDKVHVEVALQYVDDITARITAFANNTYNSEGGTHITGFKTALTRTLNNYGKKSGNGKEEDSFTGDDVLEGLTAIVSVKLREIQFEGQTKAKLGSVEARGAVETVFSEAFTDFLETHPDEARQIIGKAVLAMKARKAAKAAKDSVLRKGALDGMTLPGKLADCQTKDATEAEIFIVEGDSAGGCFSGDTKVALADGRNLTFKELVAEDAAGKQNYCYTIDDNSDVAIAPILHPRVTKQNAEVLKIILDSGEEITCTPDHRFMLRDGSYKEARDLTPVDSLMPLRRKTRDKSLLRLDTILSRFFHDDRAHLEKAIMNFNHRIIRVEVVTERMDVYDIEIPGTHNFALASGVFVHNSSKMGRDRRTQAILPLRGKILNVERARLDKMLASNEIKNLVIAMGTAIGDLFDIGKLRYHKIIIATDADVDGAHIRTLLLTLFYRYFKSVIEGGYLYIAQPPLYKVKKGKEVSYAYSDAEKVRLLGKEAAAEIADETRNDAKEEEENPDAEPEGGKPKLGTPKISIQRYKGLGEMNPEELWETTMDPARRILKQVTIEDAQDADRVFDILMGTDVPARKSFIQSNAKAATLDI